MAVLQTLALVVIGLTAVMAQRRLALPDPRSCSNRKLPILVNIEQCM